MSVFENFISSITGGDLLGKLIVAIVLVCTIAVVSHVLVKWLRHIMQRDDTSIPQSSIFINIMRGIVWGLGCCFVLDTCFNVNMSALIAALGVGGIALSLGFQDTLSNLIGGVQISFLGETVIIPNSVISKNAVVHLPPPERVSVPFVATTCKDLDAVAGEVERVAHDIALEHTGIVKEPSVLFTEITEGGLAGKVVLEVEDAAQATPVSDAITRAIAPLVRA